ncbi:MDR/zinc-dependent alcohol dehydrogenase-like family protein [Candidatus Magnetaquicoccus inordinatus]|uniref:MDR/zinc-dependent alcohol dehydrogenase-like family protein n=1 Tax=Candidatus Magnetaquicoccus inordinatus TaxID=2496818 RepID=UPI00102BE7BC|nr:alcohol dehydrogenase catalytic domain-containing protein [Candidatus Magnetaquicoccus inordinatus]
MRALLFNGQQLQLGTAHPLPQPTAQEALLRIRLAGICATDLAILRGYKGFTGVLGHEFVAEVVACADPSWLQARVVGEINCGCGSCSFCARGNGNHCLSRRVVGIQGRDGMFAQYACLPVANLHRLPDSLSDQQAVFTEPLAAALRITEQITLAAGEPVAIVGDGRLGILVAHVLAHQGCADLYMVGHHPEHFSLWPASLKGHWHPEQLPEDFSFATIIECSGAASGWRWALAKVQPQGRIVLKSTFPGGVPVEPADWVVRELQIIGSRCGPFAPALSLLETATLPVEKMISAIYPLSDALTAFAHAQRKGALKILLAPEEE